MEGNSKRKAKTSAAGESTRRSDMLQARKDRERKQQRQRQQMLALIIGASVLVVVAMIVFLNAPAEAPLPEGVLERYSGLEVSRTEQGFFRLGSPDAPVRVEEFSSFGCPGCKQFHDAYLEPILTRIRAGEINFTYVPMHTPGSLVNREGAARAAVCAGEQGRFWEMHDVLFEWHGTYANQAFTPNRLASGASALGLDTNAFNGCLNGSGSAQVVTAAENYAQTIPGFRGTPTVTVQGVVVASDITAINDAINQALAVAPASNPVVPTPDSSAPAAPTADVTPEAALPTAEPAAEGTPGS